MYRQAGLMALVSISLVTAPAMAQEAHGQESVVASSDVAALDPRFDQQVLQARSLRPPRSAWRTGSEVVASVAGGGVMATGGFLLGAYSGFVASYHLDKPCPDYDCDADWDTLDHTFLGGLIGIAALYPLGAGLGVGLVGRAGDQTGSLGAAIQGSYTGALAGAVTGAALGWMGVALTDNGSDDNRYSEQMMILGGVAGVLVAAPIGAWIGFDRTRAYESAPLPPLAGLVSVDENRTRLTVPVISIVADPLHAGHVMTSVRVIDARF